MHQRQLARGQLHDFAVQVQGATVLVITNGANLRDIAAHWRGARVGTAPYQGAQAGFEFVQIKGFGQVVVSPGVQPHHPVAHGAARGEDQHRCAQAECACTLQHLQAVQAGQGQVEHHGVGHAPHPLAESCLAITHRCHLHATPRQRALQGGLHGGVVFY